MLLLRNLGSNYGKLLLTTSPLRIRFLSTFKDSITISDRAASALNNREPMVALESTVLTHGMSWPVNFETCLELEEIIRRENSVPVTIGVLNNVIKAGFTSDELKELAGSLTTLTKPKKLSRRDLYNVTNVKYGGTTVSATAVIANKLGIKVFATGGIGGVHRDVSTTMDVSADLRELGRTPICVVSSGIKSFLDISKTLEYLETEGVFVCTLGSDDFPGFFVKSSGVRSPHRVNTIDEAAEIVASMERLDISSGMLLAVPIPDCLEDDGFLIQQAIETSLATAQKLQITGSEVSPFILKNVTEITKGKSLHLNIKLIKHNAMIAGKLAVCLNKLHQPQIRKTVSEKQNTTFAVIGGSVVDNNLKFLDSTVKSAKDILPQAFHNCTSVQTSGGVGRNLADVFSQLGQQCFFMSAIGNDLFGDFLRTSSPTIDWSMVKSIDNVATSHCSAIMLSNNDVLYYFGNLDISKHITVDYIAKQLEPIKTDIKLMCLDCNLSIETLEYAVNFSKCNGINVLLEPTDILLLYKLPELLTSTKRLMNPVDIISPNIIEFQHLYNLLKIDKLKDDFHLPDIKQDGDNQFEFVKLVVENTDILEIIPCWIIKFGAAGVVLASKEEFFFMQQSSSFMAPGSIACVSGAGDCLVAYALFLRFSKGFTWEESIAGGIRMAKESIKNEKTVPSSIDLNKFYNVEIKKWIKEMYEAKLLICTKYKL